jgi:hypothetical protein
MICSREQTKEALLVTHCQTSSLAQQPEAVKMLIQADFVRFVLFLFCFCFVCHLA